jgi:hypothetical protein
MAEYYGNADHVYTFDVSNEVDLATEEVSFEKIQDSRSAIIQLAIFAKQVWLDQNKFFAIGMAILDHRIALQTSIHELFVGPQEHHELRKALVPIALRKIVEDGEKGMGRFRGFAVISRGKALMTPPMKNPKEWFQKEITDKGGIENQKGAQTVLQISLNYREPNGIVASTGILPVWDCRVGNLGIMDATGDEIFGSMLV